MSRMIESTTVRTGRNAEHPSFDDAQYIKCWHCGFLCHPQRDARGGRGDGVTPVNLVYDSEEIDYDDSTIEYDQTPSALRIDSGCPMCGCLTYDKERPNG